MTELETVDNSYNVDLYEALCRLKKNPDFQKVILEGYMKDKAMGLVSLLGMPEVKRRGERPDVMEELVAISNLQTYFKGIEFMSRVSPIEDDEEGTDNE